MNYTKIYQAITTLQNILFFRLYTLKTYWKIFNLGIGRSHSEWNWEDLSN